MSDPKHVKVSKFLSLVLRHKPETIGLPLDEEGWADVDELLQKMAAHGRRVTRAVLDEVVANNNKKRFAFSEDGDRIRASQGHSIMVDLGLKSTEPPGVLFHGTVGRFLGQIMAEGLKPGQRQHVHLSKDRETAVIVGSRRGQAVVLEVDAAAMVEAGHEFFESANGVWLTDHVPPEFLQPTADEE